MCHKLFSKERARAVTALKNNYSLTDRSQTPIQPDHIMVDPSIAFYSKVTTDKNQSIKHNLKPSDINFCYWTKPKITRIFQIEPFRSTYIYCIFGQQIIFRFHSISIHIQIQYKLIQICLHFIVQDICSQSTYQI